MWRMGTNRIFSQRCVDDHCFLILFSYDNSLCNWYQGDYNGLYRAQNGAHMIRYGFHVVSIGFNRVPSVFHTIRIYFQTANNGSRMVRNDFDMVHISIHIYLQLLPGGTR